MSIRRSICAVALSLSVGLAGVARAQAPEPPDTNPDLAQPPAPPPPRPEQPAIASAQSPALDPDPASLPAYRLRLGIDLPVIGALAVITSTRLFKSGSASCAPLCDRSNVNALDRVTAGYYSTGWQRAADIGLYGILVGSAAALAIDEGFVNGLNDATVVTESILASSAISSMLTLQAGRPRPLLYSEKAPLSRRTGADAGMSFLSGHAAVGFAAATSVFMTLHRRHPHSAGPWVVLGAGSLVATFIAVGRTMGGNHFISDNALAAVAGVSMGVMFPSLHGSPIAVVPLVGESQRGLAVQSRF
jgi:hypothetical protein